MLARRLTELEPNDGELAQAWRRIVDEGATMGRVQLALPGRARRLVDYSATLGIRSSLTLLSLRDVTEQRATEARFQAMIEKSSDGISLLGADATAIYQSPAVERIFGWSTDEAKTMAWQDFVPEEERPKLANVLAKLLERPNETHAVTFRMRHRAGGLRWVELAGTNLLADPLVAAIVTNFRDVTERKAMEREIEGFFELTPDLLAIAGTDGRFKRVNAAWSNTLGWTDSELLSGPWLDFVHPEDRETTAREGARLAAGLETIRFENRYRCHDGSYRWLQWSCKSVPDEQLIFTCARDITEQRDASARDRALFTESPLPKFVIDDESRRFIDVNEAALQLYGYTRQEFLAKRAEDLVVPEERDEVRKSWAEAMAADATRTSSRHHLTKAGARLAVDVTSKRIALGGRSTILSTSRDTTAERGLKVQLAQAQKLESIGNLAGGVAHDFNNLMSIILSYTLLMLQDLPPDNRFRADLEEIKRAGERATELTHQLLAFSRQQLLEPQAVDLATVLQSMGRMLKRLLREDIELNIALPAQVGHVHADPGQLEQVIINLAVNARDAMPNGGRLTIEAKDVDLEGQWALDDQGLSEGGYVMLAVTDTGHGMDEATRSRLFEPFFTTKPKGQGTGLGLSVVFGIVKQSGGHIWVYSEVGQGTTFKIFLPRTEKPSGATKRFVATRSMAPASETILLAEDENAVRTVTCAVLTRAGYHVLPASNGEDALRLARDTTEPIHLLLTDVVMPGMGGRVLAERMMALLPNIKVLYMSGYTDDAIVHHGVLDAGMHFYQKPVTPHALLQRVRDVLDAAR
jgi:PAS domain S-box-containing protein